MATVTPSFSWPVPTSTDLVKDGATAIEALGDAIDASMTDLKGGTTGQVLSKTTGADMDFTWVTTDDANAIQNSIVDAKGDLIGASANDTPARLAVGANGETLVADSAATTGLRWNPSPTIENPVINGAYDIAQRGTTFTTAGGFGYTLDRWISRTAAGLGSMVTTRETTGDTTNLPFIQYCARVRRSTGNTNTFALELSQALETSDSIPFVGRAVTFSFYARKSVNFTGTFTALLLSGTGTDQSLPVSFTSVATVAGAATTLTTTWTRYTFTGTPSASATQLGIVFRHTPSGTAGADDYYEVTGVQIDLGSVALPFNRAGGTIQGELAAAQRYYYRVVGGNGGAPFGSGQCASTTAAVATMSFPVTMRIRPTALEQSGTAGDYKLYRAGTADENCTAVPTFNNSSPNQAVITATVAANIVAGNATIFSSTNATAYLGWSAEL